VDKEKKEKLRTIFWDYDVHYTADEIYDFLVGKKEIKEFHRHRLIARLLSSMRWYDLIDIFGLPQVQNFLSDDTLKFIWKKSIRNRYQNVRQTLQQIL
jgi:hypothetical protein